MGDKYVQRWYAVFRGGLQMSAKWKVDWDNDVYGEDCYVEWWYVSDWFKTFKADSEEDALWLAEVLNKEKPQNKPDE